ncbi:hypothetical protein M8J76_007674 [Diaphorina citri]|nr:hypothetical protein M8J76_007674 [Diaphorina citri]
MENYSKGSNEEEPWDLTKVPIPNIPDDIIWMKVSPGAKMRNVLEFALKDFQDKDLILWSGSGPALTKTISCAEIMKNKCRNLHQISAICYRKVTEYWDPLIDALDQLKTAPGGTKHRPRRNQNRDQKPRNPNSCDLGLIRNKKSRPRTEPKTPS